MGERIKHRQIYRQIPTFKCKSGCTGCCGPVPVTEYEADRLGISGELMTPTKPDSLTCEYATADGCSVYDKRPFMCRLFGAVDTPMLTCPYGCKPKTLLTEKQGKELRNEYMTLGIT